MSTTTTTATELSSADKEFMNKAAQAGISEIQAAEMALSKTNNEDVRQFAQRMIDDHTKANNELKDIAARKGVTLPTEPNEDQKETASDLKEYSGEDFDAEYMDAQIDAHETVIDFFQDEIDDGSDADVVAFAEKTLPTLESHLEMAENVNDNL